MIRLRIDGKEIESEPGKTILEVARENEIYIPTLCYYERLLPIGSCRLCIVEIDGYDKPQTSCTTIAVDGISVITQSDRLFQMRQEFLKFILMGHPLDCPICDKAGNCKLQDLVHEHRIEKAPYIIKDDRPPKDGYSTPLIRKWNKRCVLCGRCFHACREVSGRSAIDIKGNGFNAMVEAIDPNDCISCGECINVCPVGALTEALSPIKSRPWMGRQVETVCPHCGFGCAIQLDILDDYVTQVRAPSDTMPNKGSLCARGRFGYDFINHEERIKVGTINENGAKRTVKLEDAIGYAIDGLKRLSGEGKKIGFVISPRVTNEEIYLITEFARSFKNSLIASSSSFHTGRLYKALKEAGIAYDFNYQAIKDCGLIINCGAGLLSTNHLLGNLVREAFKTKGTRVVTINPEPVPLTRISDCWLKIRPGTDHILFNGISRYLVENGLYEKDREGYNGFGDFLDSIKPYTEDKVLKACEIDERLFKKALGLIKESGEIGLIFGPGVTEGQQGISAILNLSILKGIKLFPTTPQANAVGISLLTGDVLSPVDVVKDPEVKALFIYEEELFNLMEEEGLKASLSEKELIITFSYLPTKTSSFAHVLLPPDGFAEKDGTYISGDGSIRHLKKAIDQAIDKGIAIYDLLERMYSLTQGRALEGLELGKVIDLAKEGRPEAKGFVIQGEQLEQRGQVEGDGLSMILKDLFINPYIVSSAVYSKGIGMLQADIVYCSEEDAITSGVKEGDEVILDGNNASIKAEIHILKGLKKGVIVAQPFKERTILRLFKDGERKTFVKMRKA